MAGKPTVTLTLAGDAAKLSKTTKESEDDVRAFGKAAQDSGQEAKKGFDFGTFAAVGLADAIGNMGDTVDSVQSAFRASSETASRLARAQNDVAQASADARQAQLDLRQSTRDSAQAQLDAQQALIDAKVAQDDYNTAVKEFGPNSAEAMQATLDLKQAKEDGKQADEDARQAVEDGKQAQIDAKGAALDLADAQTAASDASGWQGWLQTISGIAPGLLAVVLAVNSVGAAVVTKAVPAVWSFTAALLANPITWIVALIGGLIAAFVLLWNKSAAFRDFFIGMWNGIKSTVGAVATWVKGAWEGVVGFFSNLPGRIGSALGSLGGIVKNVFKGVVNTVVDALNWFLDNTINWLINRVNDISGVIGIPAIPTIPHIPRMHSGGVVPGLPGEETLMVLQGGEEVSTSSQRDSSGGRLVVAGDGALARLIQKMINDGDIYFEGATA